MTDDKATPADVTRADIDALVTELREFGQAVTVGWLSADRYARAAVALAAERDRANRAEAEAARLRKIIADIELDWSLWKEDARWSEDS